MSVDIFGERILEWVKSTIVENKQNFTGLKNKTILISMFFF